MADALTSFVPVGQLQRRIRHSLGRLLFLPELRDLQNGHLPLSVTLLFRVLLKLLLVPIRFFRPRVSTFSLCFSQSRVLFITIGVPFSLTIIMSAKKRKMQPSPTQLPSELVFAHILPRLAAEALLRFSSVSKLWCTMISDPNFVYSHFLRSKENPRLVAIFDDENGKEKHLILNFGSIINFKGEGDGSISMDAEKLKKTSITGPHRQWVGSCNGLICFRVYFNFTISDLNTQKTSVIRYGMDISNPSTREVLLVPLPNVDEDVHCLSHYGFGYDAVSKEYKLVCIYNSNKCVMVYTLGTNSWRSLPVPTHMPHHFSYVDEIAVFLDGALYWYTRHDNTSELFSFDMHEEKFRMIPAPSKGTNPMFLLEGSLCLPAVDFEDITLHTWKKDHTKHYWSRKSIALPPGDGELFIFCSDGVVAFLDKVLLHWSREKLFTLYNLRTGTQKEVKLLDNFSFFGYQILSHVENLLSLQNFVPCGESEVVYVNSVGTREEDVINDLTQCHQAIARNCHFLYAK